MKYKIVWFSLIIQIQNINSILETVVYELILESVSMIQVKIMKLKMFYSNPFGVYVPQINIK